MSQNKIKIKPLRCDKCRQTMTPIQAIRFMWKKRNAYLDLCPTCFAKIFKEHLKDVSIKKEAIKKSGYYKEGAREVDFKSYLWKWAEQIKQGI